MVGLAVSLADKDTFADRSTREFVESHWSDPLIPRRVVRPVASSLFFPLSLCRFFGRLSSTVDDFSIAEKPNGKKWQIQKDKLRKL